MTIEVPIPLDEIAADALRADPVKRAAIGRLVSDWLRPEGRAARLVAAMDRLGDDARAKGLTDEILNEELAAYNQERRH